MTTGPEQGRPRVGVARHRQVDAPDPARRDAARTATAHRAEEDPRRQYDEPLPIGEGSWPRGG